MLELKVFSGGKLASRHQFGRETVSIGRLPSSDLVLAVPGIWERHAEIRLSGDGRFEIRPAGEGLVMLGGEPVTQSSLRPGDRISLGSVELEFQIVAPRQRQLAGLEAALWFLIVVGVLVQATLIVILMR
jgi:pSer/pThr/pTyr-binding forkhead associated (FHA) protein